MDDHDTAPAPAINFPLISQPRPHESWAEAKGFLPQMIPGPTPAGAPQRLVPNPEFGRYASARAFSGWSMGQEMTEAQFDEAMVAAANVTHR